MSLRRHVARATNVALVGAAVMYFADPDNGAARRHQTIRHLRAVVSPRRAVRDEPAWMPGVGDVDLRTPNDVAPAGPIGIETDPGAISVDEAVALDLRR